MVGPDDEGHRVFRRRRRELKVKTKTKPCVYGADARTDTEQGGPNERGRRSDIVPGGAAAGQGLRARHAVLGPGQCQDAPVCAKRTEVKPVNAGPRAEQRAIAASELGESTKRARRSSLPSSVGRSIARACGSSESDLDHRTFRIACRSWPLDRAHAEAQAAMA